QWPDQRHDHHGRGTLPGHRSRPHLSLRIDRRRERPERPALPPVPAADDRPALPDADRRDPGTPARQSVHLPELLGDQRISLEIVRKSGLAALRSHSNSTISRVTSAIPAAAIRRKATSRLSARREAVASVTTKTGLPAAASAKAVCRTQTWASIPASTICGLFT